MPQLFTYGSLMRESDFKKNGQCAIFNDHTIKFIVPGHHAWEPCFATVVKNQGKKAWGVVTEVSDEQLARYQALEMSYRLQEIEVITKNGTAVKCYCFMINTRGLSKQIAPSMRYMRLLYLGARYHGFPRWVIKRYWKLMKLGCLKSFYLRWIYIYRSEKLLHM